MRPPRDVASCGRNVRSARFQIRHDCVLYRRTVLRVDGANAEGREMSVTCIGRIHRIHRHWFRFSRNIHGRDERLADDVSIASAVQHRINVSLLSRRRVFHPNYHYRTDDVVVGRHRFRVDRRQSGNGGTKEIGGFVRDRRSGGVLLQCDVVRVRIDG